MSSSLYAALPVFAQNLVCDAYGLKTRRERFGRAFESRLQSLLESEWWDAGAISRHQDAEVRDLVRHAYDNVPFYRERMRAAGVDPAAIQSVADLPLLPITTKRAVREQGERMKARNMARHAAIEMHTSGTTGTALSFEVDRSALPFRWAVWWRHRVRFGVHPGEWHVNFTGKPVVPAGVAKPPFWRRSRPLRQYLVNMQHLSPDRIESLAGDLDRLAPIFYSGYPSIVHAYCRLVAEARITLRNPPRFVFTGAENMLDHQRRDIGAVTGATLTDQYGLSEGCGNASHCAEMVYHEDFEFGVLECADPEVLPSGETRGRIVATGFASQGFPFVRYDTGDVGVWAEPGFRCPCGRHSRVLKRIEGRADDYVITPEGRRIMRFDYLFKDTAGIREAQIVQPRLGEILIRVVLEKGAPPDELTRLRELVAEWISPSLRVEFEAVDRIERERNGKFKAVVSLLSEAVREGRGES